MLRVIVEIVPFGEEAEAYTVGVINLGNTLDLVGEEHRYQLVAKSSEGYTLSNGSILHKRTDGWVVLVIKALQSIKILMPHFDKPK